MLEVVTICAFAAIVICITAFAISIVNASVRIKEINARQQVFEKRDKNDDEDDSEER